MSRKMKALSIKQPWAWLIANGYKTLETRTWTTEYRGPLLIVASKKPDKDAFADFGAFVIELFDAPLGQAVAIANLVDCRPMTEEDEGLACCHCRKGAYSWVLEDVQEIKPFPVKGRLGLYDVEVPDECMGEEAARVPGWFDNGTGEGSVAG